MSHSERKKERRGRKHIYMYIYCS